MKLLSKTKNLIILCITAVITLILAFFCLTPATVASAGTSEPKITQVNGASIAANLDNKVMKFDFNFDKGNVIIDGKMTKQEFKFELYRLNVNSYSNTTNYKVALSSEEVKALDSSKYSLVDTYTITNANQYYTSEKYHGKNATKENYYKENSSKGIIYYVNFENGKISVCFKPESMTVGYFVKVTANFKRQISIKQDITRFSSILPPIYVYTENEYTYSTADTSSARSYSYVLEKVIENEDFKVPDESLTVEDVKNIYIEQTQNLSTATYQNITVEYLEQIGTSSFATKKTKTVNTLVYPNNTLDIKQLESSMNVQTLDVFGTITNDYKFEDNIYKLIYAKDVRLASKTVDGNTVNQFLDINKSFYDFYFPMKQNGIINDDLYEWFLSQVKGTNDSLKSLTYNDRNIYGYWGYAVVPETYSLNGIISDLFDGGTVYKGKLVQYTYKSLLTLDGYNALLRDYQYPWLSRVWNDGVAIVAGTVANHVLIVSEPNVKETVVSQNGSTDADNDKGLIRNETENIISNIGDKIGGIFGNAMKKGKSIIYGLIIGAVAILAIYIIFKDRGKK